MCIVEGFSDTETLYHSFCSVETGLKSLCCTNTIACLKWMRSLLFSVQCYWQFKHGLNQTNTQPLVTSIRTKTIFSQLVHFDRIKEKNQAINRPLIVDCFHDHVCESTVICGSNFSLSSIFIASVTQRINPDFCCFLFVFENFVSLSLLLTLLPVLM